MDPDKKQLLCTCYHCGNKGQLNVVGEDTYSFVTQEDDVQGSYVWKMLFCPVCHKITLYQDYSDSEMIDPEEGFYDEESILYPENRFDLKGVPPQIKSALESAIKVKNIDTALCAIALRRVLEQICNDKEAKGKNLDKMIKDLISRNILPNGFDEACSIIRLLGNSAAHGSESVFYISEVEELISLLKAIIDYLYVIPKRISGLQRNITIKEAKAESES